ncbi:MAG TPA: cation diffusion facilitator family transporter [Solirubrobacteraceae bacterium]|jgi:cobalt-zinc-cadmium efflux system protein|nr:cation diffusion facilitator family transporter [Solirubrobacteraceae bacterium]
MTKATRLGLVLLANAGMVVALVLVGLASHSLGVLAAGGDYLGDAAGVALSLAALRISHRPNGHRHATSYAALTNATFLLAVTAVVIVAAIRRLVGSAPHVAGLPVIIVSVIAGLVMAGCALIIGRVERDDLNMRSVMLDTLADGTSAAGVALSGAIILLAHGLYRLDSAVALGIAAIIAYHAVRLIHDVLAVLRTNRRVTPDAPGGAIADDVPSHPSDPVELCSGAS